MYTKRNTCNILVIIINLDIIDIKPANMEDLAEVITAAEFHPTDCSSLVNSREITELHIFILV